MQETHYLQVFYNIIYGVVEDAFVLELRNVHSLGLGFGLEPQTPGLGLELGLETCWTRTPTRVLPSKTRTRQNVDSLHLCYLRY